VDQEVFIAKEGVLHGGGKKRRPVMDVSFGISPPTPAPAVSPTARVIPREGGEGKCEVSPAS